MAVLKLTVIIFLIFIANAYGGEKDNCCQIVESIKSMVSQGPACPEGWVHREESCYRVINTPTLKQSDARKTCQNLGGDLAIIRSREENNFIKGLVTHQETVPEWGVWLGLTRKADNKFYWIDGTPLVGGFTAWGAGEPNNYGGNEDCGNMYGRSNVDGESGEWNDIWCAIAESYLQKAPSVLCQKKSE